MMRAGGYTLQVRQDRQHLYILAQLASSNRRWYTSWFYLRNDDGGLPPYTGRIVEDCPEKWRYGIPREEQPKLQPLLDGLEKLRNRCLTVAMVMAAFHRQRVLPLMARRWRLFDMRPDEPIEGIWMFAVPLSDEGFYGGRGRRGGAAEERWLDPYRDAPVAGVSLAGKSRAAAAPEAS